MNKIILLEIMAVHATVMSMLPQLNITLNVLCTSSVEVSCTGVDNAYGLWTFYKKNTGRGLQNMARVFYNESGCSVGFLFTIRSSQCVCKNGSGVMCNMFGDNVVNAGDEWYCSKFSTGLAYSEKVYLNFQETGECTTTILEHTSVEGTEYTTVEGTTIKTSFNNSKAPYIEVVHTVTDVLANYTTPESENYSSTPHQSNMSSTQKEERDIVYFQTINHQVTQIDNTAGRNYAMEAQISPQENTYSHYQDISDVSNRSSVNASTVTINPAGNNQNNASTKAVAGRFDNSFATPAKERDTINQIMTMTDNDPSTLRAGSTLGKEKKPLLFMALAEINITDVATIENEIDRTDVASVRYEYLDPTSRDKKSQYTSLV
ncbi:uncharacterized protein LOC127867646 isoform X2 [Dreissena polymorpha]|uniref:uncharacterized protein LOC127867646 isoform X2 n=1 Tax=Dreissena polymorpha TaxID=45954 RepID=UPI0022649F33|nr:uncharacterized protein LOC127867646 isoform X2 [Dreissena polymorpha]